MPELALVCALVALHLLQSAKPITHDFGRLPRRSPAMTMGSQHLGTNGRLQP
jgi:hypothetical protein